MDIVYGSITPEKTTAGEVLPVSIIRKTEVVYKGSLEARRNSGAPGYIKGLKLKTATKSTDPDKMTDRIKAAKAIPYLLEPVEGFKLFGANN